jgi:hypothetical protein
MGLEKRKHTRNMDENLLTNIIFVMTVRCNALPKSRQKLYKKSRDIFKLPFLELVV